MTVEKKKKNNGELSRLITALRGVSNHIVEHTPLGRRRGVNDSWVGSTTHWETRRNRLDASTPATIFEACYFMPSRASEPAKSISEKSCMARTRPVSSLIENTTVSNI